MKKVFSLFLVLLAFSFITSCSNMSVLQEGGSICVALKSNQARIADGVYEESDAEEYEILIKGKTQISKKYTAEQLYEGVYYDNIAPGEYTVIVKAYGNTNEYSLEENDSAEKELMMIAYGSTSVQVFSGSTANARVFLYPMNEFSFEITGLSIQDIEYKLIPEYVVNSGNFRFKDMFSAAVTYSDGTVINFDSVSKIADLTVDTSNLRGYSSVSKIFVGDIPVEITYGAKSEIEKPITKEIIIPVKYQPQEPVMSLSGSGSIAAYTGVKTYTLEVTSNEQSIFVYGTDEEITDEYKVSIGLDKNGIKNVPAEKMPDIDSSERFKKEYKIGMYKLKDTYDSKYTILGRTEIIVDDRYAVPKDEGYSFEKTLEVNVVDYGFDLTTENKQIKVSGSLSKGAEYNLYLTNYADPKVASSTNPYSKDELKWILKEGTEIEDINSGSTELTSNNPFKFKINTASIGVSENITLELNTKIEDVNGEEIEVSVSKTKEIFFSTENVSLYNFTVNTLSEDTTFEAKLNENGKVDLDLEKFKFEIMNIEGEVGEVIPENISYTVPTYTFSKTVYPYIGKVSVTFTYTANGQILSTSKELIFVHTLEPAKSMKILYSVDDGETYSEVIDGTIYANVDSTVYLKAEVDKSNFTQYVYYGASNKKVIADSELYFWEEEGSIISSNKICSIYVSDYNKTITCSYTPSTGFDLFEIQPYLVSPNGGVDLRLTQKVDIFYMY